MTATEQPAWQSRLTRIGLWLGPALFIALGLIAPPQGMTATGMSTLALLIWMVVWWISEAVPIAVTALLPLALLPILGAATGAQAAAPYADEIIFLFIGGFILALAIERWNLHTRIALALAALIGSQPRALIGSFVLASGLISMWISNTATALMLMPTAIGVANAMHVEGKTDPRFGGALVLAVAHAASIGGIGTPIGSPTNLIAMSYLERTGLSLSFLQWMQMAVPMMGIMLIAAWLVLSWDFRRMPADGLAAQDVIGDARRRLGAMCTPEWRVLMVFLLVAFAWMLRPLINQLPALKSLSDTGIAIIGVVLLFVIPAGKQSTNSTSQPSEAAIDRAKLMTWAHAERLPWGVALLFGGGMSVAEAMKANGVTEWLGQAMVQLGTLNPFVILLLVVLITMVVTEFASNVATLTAILPVIGAFSAAAGLPPLVLAFAASMAATLAFMMPIGTAANAIAFGTGKLTIGYMLRVGFILNIVSILTITIVTQLLAPLVLGR
jgi:solute carrier family 13 (sodium-dependent dicarboxylate transporter), member 2/3/5